jgi:hypothetical protein
MITSSTVADIFASYRHPDSVSALSRFLQLLRGVRRPESGAILLVADLFHPIDVFAVEPFSNEDSSSLLGGLLVTTLGLAAYTRVDTPKRQPARLFCLYRRISEPYHVGARQHALRTPQVPRRIYDRDQYLHQLTPEIRHAVLGNVGTFVSFRIGPEDAPYVVREFQSNFAQEDLIQLENYRIYLKLMINGMPSWPFSARTLRSSELAQLAGLISRDFQARRTGHATASSTFRDAKGMDWIPRCKRW